MADCYGRRDITQSIVVDTCIVSTVVLSDDITGPQRLMVAGCTLLLSASVKHSAAKKVGRVVRQISALATNQN